MGGIVAIVLVASLIIGIVAFAASFPSFSPASSGPTFRITGERVASPDDACGLQGDDSGTYQSLPDGGGPAIVWGLPGPTGTLPCTVKTVSTNMSGFQLFAALPMNVTSSPAVLIVQIFSAPASFDGVLNVTFT